MKKRLRHIDDRDISSYLKYFNSCEASVKNMYHLSSIH